jgi:hypothetical protein
VQLGIELAPYGEHGVVVRITPGGEGVVNLLDNLQESQTEITEL